MGPPCYHFMTFPPSSPISEDIVPPLGSNPSTENIFHGRSSSPPCRIVFFFVFTFYPARQTDSLLPLISYAFLVPSDRPKYGRSRKAEQFFRRKTPPRSFCLGLKLHYTPPNWLVIARWRLSEPPSLASPTAFTQERVAPLEGRTPRNTRHKFPALDCSLPDSTQTLRTSKAPSFLSLLDPSCSLGRRIFGQNRRRTHMGRNALLTLRK